jgi:hypothetical protein
LSQFQNSVEEQLTAQNNRRKGSAEECDGKAVELKREFGVMKTAREAEFRRAAIAKEQLVQDARINLDVNEVKHESEMKEWREKKEVEMAELDELREFRTMVSTNKTLDGRLGESKRRRDMERNRSPRWQ